MALTSKSIRELKEALPTGTIISIIKRNGKKVHDHINNKGWSVSLKTNESIDFYSPHTMSHSGEINFALFDKCSISKTNIILDNCIIAIKKKCKE